jgi:hypothetical protein
MCEKCDEIEAKIKHYRRISRQVTDQLTQERLSKMFDDMEAQKKAFHVDQK